MRGADNMNQGVHLKHLIVGLISFSHVSLRGNGVLVQYFTEIKI